MVGPNVQGVSGLSVLAFENDTQRTSHSGYYLLHVEIKNYNVMINEENVFNKPVKNNKVTYKNIRRIATGKGDDYTTGCLLNYPYFKDKMMHKNNKRALDADSRAIQQINFSANLDRDGNTRIYFILEEAKETILNFSQRTVKAL